MDPGRFLQLLKEAARASTRESPATELRLRRHLLTIVVANDRARTTRELVVRNLSEAPDEEASIVVDPRSVLGYLAAQTRPFVLSFPPREGSPLLCQSECFRFALMPLEQAGKSESGVPEIADRPRTTVPEQEHEASLKDEDLSA